MVKIRFVVWSDFPISFLIFDTFFHTEFGNICQGSDRAPRRFRNVYRNAWDPKCIINWQFQASTIDLDLGVSLVQYFAVQLFSLTTCRPRADPRRACSFRRIHARFDQLPRKKGNKTHLTVVLFIPKGSIIILDTFRWFSATPETSK